MWVSPKTFHLRVERTESAARRLVTKKGGVVVDIPRSMRRRLALLPVGTMVETLCLPLQDDLLRLHAIVAETLPTAVENAARSWKQGDYKGALAALLSEGYPIESDPHRLGWRVRLQLDLEQDEAAARDIALLLGLHDDLDVGDEPPGVLNLFASFRLKLREQLAPVLVRRAKRFNYQSHEVGRLMDLVRIELWANAYLAYRLKAEVSAPRVKVWVREAERRIAELAEEEQERVRLERALQVNARESKQLAKNRALRKTKKKAAHPLLRRALSAATKAARPRPPFHALGPPPALTGRQREELERWLAAETERRTGGMLKTPPRHLVGGDTRGVVSKAVKSIADASSDEVVRTFLLDMDQEMMRIELRERLRRARATGAAAAAERFEKTEPRILYRGVEDESNRVQAWLVAIDGRFGLVCQVKGVWLWVEGTFDEVVASMPDQWFEGAATAVASL